MTAPWQRARRILCVRLDSLGDVLMCTPAMRALRQAVPVRTLTLLGAPSGVAAAPHIPELDDAIAWTAPWSNAAAVDRGGMPATHDAAPEAAPEAARQAASEPASRPARPQGHQAGLALIATLAARAFDAAVIFTTYTQSALPAALLCQLAGIPLRLAHCRENPYGLLTDWIPDPEPATLVRHEVQRQLALAQRVGCRGAGPALSFVPRPADVAAARLRLSGAGVDPDRPWLLLHPGASAASRRYPPEHWAQVLRLLAQDARLPLVLTGSAAEAQLVDAIQFACAVPVVSLAGRLSLGELGAALRLAAVAVTNNTGPAHMAAAVGTPVVALYALTNPQHTPWHVRSRVLFHDVPCRFCYKSMCPEGHQACLAGVAPQRVVDAVRELLGTRRPAGAASTADVPDTSVPS